MKSLIVDDERLARKVLRKLVEETGEFSEIREASSVEAALILLEDYKPEIVFLDINLNRHNGFALLEKTNDEFSTIFVTAYDEHAVRAFEENAVDYLLKPVDKSRLISAITKAKLFNEAKKVAAGNNMQSKILLNIEGRIKFITVSQIRKIEASGDYTILTSLEGEELKVLKTLKEWEKKLPAEYFLRIHRSTLVNKQQIEKIDRDDKYRTHVLLKGEVTPLRISRNLLPQFLSSFQN